MANEVATLSHDLTNGDGARRSAAAERLAQLGPDAQAAAVELCRAAANEDTREWAVAALEELGPPPADQLPQLIELLDSKSPLVAYWAATLLGRLGRGAQPALAPLAKALSPSRPLEVRQQAAWALGEIGSGGVAREALQAASTDSDPRLARLARAALASLDSPARR